VTILPKSKLIAAAALGLFVASVVEAQAVDIVVPPATMQGGNAGDLQAWQNRIQRQQYQQQQQQFRAQDRRPIPLQQQSPQVPVLKPGCQMQFSGGRLVRNCR
jgi:hypothetical protein